MQSSHFICRSCLSQLRRPWRPDLATARTRVLAPAGPARFLTTEAPTNARDYDAPALLPRGSAAQTTPRKRGPDSNSAGRSTGAGRSTREARSTTADTPSASRYTEHDAAFWDILGEGWAQEEGGMDVVPMEPASRVSKAVEASKKRRPGGASSQKRPRAGKAKERTVKDIQNAQLMHLKSATEHGKWPQARKMFKEWKRNLARLEEKRDLKLMDWVSTKTEELLACDSLDAMKEAWAAMDPGRRLRIFGYVVICALESSPQKSPLLLKAMFQDPLPPAYAVQDAVQHLIRRLQGLPEEEQKSSAEDVNDLVLFLVQQSPRDYIRLRQNAIYSLMRHLDAVQLAALYRGAAGSHHPLHAYTLLQFAARFAKNSTTKELSLEVLESLLNAEALDINTPHGASLCTSILMMKEDDLVSGSVSTSPAELFQCLLDCGLNPNVITYTAIIRNLCVTKELSVAWQVFDVMKQHRIDPDAYLYSIMLNGSKLCGDFHSLRRLAVMAYTDQVRDPVVWNELLHTVFLSSVLEARENGMKPPRVLPAFGPMLRLYARFFDLEPLRKLLLVDVQQYLSEAEEGAATNWAFIRKLGPLLDELPPFQPDELLQPTTSTLGTMVLGYVKSFSKPYNVIAFYSNFRRLLKDGDPVAVSMVRSEGTLVHDIVIKALMEWRGMLRVALDVVSDMLKDATAAVGSAAPEGAAAVTSPARHPPPSVHTWSILLNGFMYFRQKRQAERILQMMREHGVQPNLVTYNTLAAGYARMQEVGRTVRALQRLEAAGHEADDFTLRAFSYLKNKGRAISQMEAMIHRKKAAKVREDARVLELLEEEKLQRAGGEEEQVDEGVEEGLKQLESAMEEMARMVSEGGEGGEGMPAGVVDDEWDITDGGERERRHAA